METKKEFNCDYRLILNEMLVPDYTCIFNIGCSIKGKITIHSQQIRALNLAYALLASREVTKGKIVAIIGAGFSGLMAASALSVVGCKIYVFEKRQTVLDIQSESNRFVHPNIFDWPNRDSNISITDLPYFNWKSCEAKILARNFKEIWKRFLKHNNNVKVFYYSEVMSVEEIYNKDDSFANIKVKSKDPQYKEHKFEDTSFDTVIYAGGFGLETNTKGNFLSYWDNDNYSQNIDEKPKVFKVYGNGDGGLMECVRTCIKNFDYIKLHKNVITSESVEQIGEIMLSIERDVLNKSRSDKYFDTSTALDQDYKNKITPDVYHKVKDLMDNTFQYNRLHKVFLFGRSKTPYDVGSTILNRMLILILIRKGLVEYKMEPLHVEKTAKSFWQLFIEWANMLLKNKASEIIIERGGPERPFFDFFHIDRKYKQEDIYRIGYRKCWPDKFFEEVKKANKEV